MSLRMIHRLSDFIAWVLRVVVKYRVDIVREHLHYAFPEKSKEEIEGITIQFYKNFCDQWLEIIKMASWTEKELLEHFSGDLSLLDSADNVFIFLGHQFNFEWANLYLAQQSNKGYGGLYLPINNKAVDEWFYKLRTKTGTVAMPANKFRVGLTELSKKPFSFCLITDQNPGDVNNAHWQNFFNREIPFLIQPFRLAQAYNAKAVFLYIEKLEKRGYYRAHLEPMVELTTEHKAEELVEIYVEKLEKAIKKEPANWLWTHRRWKYAKED